MKKRNQTTIASKAQISDAYLSLILAGKRKPLWATGKKLQRATGVHIRFWMESNNAPELLKKQLVKRGFEWK